MEKFKVSKILYFFNNLRHSSNSIVHLGDNLTGDGEGDDEQITIDLSKVPANISKIDFTVTIYDPITRGQTLDKYLMLL